MTAESKTAAAARGAVRIWTEEEKDLVWEETLKAKEENLPLTEAFRRCAKLLPHRSEAAVACSITMSCVRNAKSHHPNQSRLRPNLQQSLQWIPGY